MKRGGQFWKPGGDTEARVRAGSLTYRAGVGSLPIQEAEVSREGAG